MSVGEFKYMLGNHLLWKDYNADEVLSWTNSLLFAFEHALGRHRKHQSGCYIAMVDTRRATTVTTRTSTAGRSVSFFNAPALWKAYEVLGWSGWGNHDRTGLHPRKFTHEFLSHGVIRYEDVTSRRLPLVDLVDKGLFRIYPEFEIFDKSRKSTGLYERCVALRRALFPELKEGMRGPELIPLEHLDWAVKIARCFVKNETPEQEVKAPLILVLKILSLRRRPSRSRLLVDWIREHYNRQDLEDIIHPDMTRVADNLPENLQYLDLVRDSRYALDVPMIPDNIVERGCTIHSIRGFKYKADDLRHMPRPRLCVPRGYSEIADMNPSKRRRVDTLSEEPTATTTQSPIASSDSAPGTDHSHRDAENLTDSVGASNPLTDLEDSSTALVEATEVLSQPHDAPSGSELPKTPSVQVDDLPALTFDQPATSTDVLTQFARHQPSLPSNSRVHLLAWR